MEAKMNATNPKAGFTIRVVLTVLLVILGLLGCIPAMFTPMMFDDGDALHNPATIILAVSIVTWPPCCLIAIILAWVFRKRSNGSLRFLLLPLINLLAGGAALLWITIFQGGEFS